MGMSYTQLHMFYVVNKSRESETSTYYNLYAFVCHFIFQSAKNNTISSNILQYIAICNTSIFSIGHIVLYCSSKYCNISIYRYIVSPQQCTSHGDFMYVFLGCYLPIQPAIKSLSAMLCRLFSPCTDLSHKLRDLQHFVSILPYNNHLSIISTLVPISANTIIIALVTLCSTIDSYHSLENFHLELFRC